MERFLSKLQQLNDNKPLSGIWEEHLTKLGMFHNRDDRPPIFFAIIGEKMFSKFTITNLLVAVLLETRFCYFHGALSCKIKDRDENKWLILEGRGKMKIPT